MGPVAAVTAAVGGISAFGAYSYKDEIGDGIGKFLNKCSQNGKVFSGNMS